MKTRLNRTAGLLTPIAVFIWSHGLAQVAPQADLPSGLLTTFTNASNTSFGNPDPYGSLPAEPRFEVDIYGEGAFPGAWGRALLIRRTNTGHKGSGIVWDRDAENNVGTGNNFFIAGPQNDGAFQGDFYGGLYEGPANGTGGALTNLWRIDGNEVNSGVTNYAMSDPRRGHIQHFRDVYFLREVGPTPSVHPRLGINVGELGIGASLHVGCQVGSTGNTGTVRFSCLDETITPTRSILCDDDGDLTYGPLVSGVTSGCGTINLLPRTIDAFGNLNCSQIFDDLTNVGVAELSPTEKLDVQGNINASGFVNAEDNLAGFKLSPAKTTVLSHSSTDPNGALGVGYSAGVAGTRVTSVGDRAGMSISSGAIEVTSVGYSAGSSSTNGSRNTFVGAHSGGLVTSGGNNNTMVGAYSGGNTTTGAYNVFLGQKAGIVNAVGQGNIAVGSDWGGPTYVVGPSSGGLMNTAAFGIIGTSVSTCHTQRFGNGWVQRWGFGLDPSITTKVMRVNLAPSLADPPFSNSPCAAPDPPPACNEAYMDQSGTWWDCAAQANRSNIEVVDHRDMLLRLSRMPLYSWTAFGNDHVRHIGPMAEDFEEAFGLGVDGTMMNSIDPAGVALASAKALSVLVEEQRSTIDDQVQRINELEDRLQHMEQDLGSCCDRMGASGSNEIDVEQPWLRQNRPNPFSQGTTINYFLPRNTTKASISIYAMGGELVRSFELGGTGAGQVEVAGGSLTAGMYAYNLVVDGEEVDSKVMVVTR